jgi:hypothetical protein
MTHDEKLQWMALWAAKNGLQLKLEGECGFGRECVGVLTNGKYAAYYWCDANYKRIDNNGEVWTPPDAYHKRDCVAVLGRGEPAEAQLYDWLKWFDEHKFKVETGTQPVDRTLGALAFMMNQHVYVRLVRGS